MAGGPRIIFVPVFGLFFSRGIGRKRRFSVTGVGPGRMGPARPQTPRQRLSPLHPGLAKGPDADKRRFPPASTRGTGLREKALRAAQINAGDGITGKSSMGGAEKSLKGGAKKERRLSPGPRPERAGSGRRPCRRRLPGAAPGPRGREAGAAPWRTP